MKRCPECRRDYYDDSLVYCLDDGSALLDGPASASGEEPPTAIYRSTDASAEPPTRAQIHTTANDERSPATKNAGPLRRPQNKLLFVIPLLLLVIAVGGFFADRYYSSGSARQIASIAVLPLTNANGDPSSEYLTDGISESLINSLSRVSGLRVVPRSTVFRYKGHTTDPNEIGKILNVEAVLTGRVVQRGDSLDVQAELIDIAHDTQIWGDHYSRKVADVQILQRDLAGTIAKMLRLDKQSSQQLSNSYTAQSDAYQEYLLGRHAFENEPLIQGGPDAIQHYKRVVELDPNFAPAYAGLAHCYTELSSGSMAPSEAMPKAKDAVLKALAIDPTLAGAHRSLAQIYWWGDWNFAGAESEFRRAIELDQNDPDSYIGYGNFLSRFGRADEAEAMAKRAVELDPTSSASTMGMCRVYLYSRRFDDLLQTAQKLVSEQPDFQAPYYFRGVAYLQKGRTAEALSDLQRASTDTENLAALGYTYAVSGRRDDALKVISHIQSFAEENRFVSPCQIARVYAGLKDNDKAFEYLEKAFEVRDDGLTKMKIDVFMDNLRTDPRFADLMKRVGLS